MLSPKKLLKTGLVVFKVDLLVTISWIVARYFQHLAMNMMHPYKAVHAATAEVVGMSLNVMAEKEKGDTAANWRNMYLDNIANMLKSMQAKRADTFIVCIYHLTNQYPPSAEK